MMHYFGLPADGLFEPINGIGGCYPKLSNGNDIVNASDIDIYNLEPFPLTHYDSCWFELLYCCNEPTTDVEERNLNALPEIEQLLLSNSPNPFSDETVINFSVAKDSRVTLKVYNAIGSLVQTLQDGFLTGGSYTVTFAGAEFAKGVYYYILTEGASAAMRGMLLVK